MRNARQTNDINIQAADYDYMDKMPLAGWIWEFIRRSAEYKKHYRAVTQELELLAGKKKIAPLKFWDDIQARFAGFYRLDIMLEQDTIYPSVHFSISFEHEDNIVTVGAPRPEAKYRDFPEDAKPKIEGICPVKVTPFDKDKMVFGSGYDCSISSLLPLFDDSDKFLFIAVRRDAKMKDLKEYIPAAVKPFLTEKKERARDDKWKMGLICYDLKTTCPDLSYEKIATIIGKTYPDYKTKAQRKKDIERKKEDKKPLSSSLIDTKNCENYYKKASKLINGEYKKLLLLAY